MRAVEGCGCGCTAKVSCLFVGAMREAAMKIGSAQYQVKRRRVVQMHVLYCIGNTNFLQVQYWYHLQTDAALLTCVCTNLKIATDERVHTVSKVSARKCLQTARLQHAEGRRASNALSQLQVLLKSEESMDPADREAILEEIEKLKEDECRRADTSKSIKKQKAIAQAKAKKEVKIKEEEVDRILTIKRRAKLEEIETVSRTPHEILKKDVAKFQVSSTY